MYLWACVHWELVCCSCEDPVALTCCRPWIPLVQHTGPEVVRHPAAQQGSKGQKQIAIERQRTTERRLNPTQLLLFLREPSREASLKRLIPLICAVMQTAGWGWRWRTAAASSPQLCIHGWEGGTAWLGLGGWPLATGHRAGGCSETANDTKNDDTHHRDQLLPVNRPFSMPAQSRSDVRRQQQKVCVCTSTDRYAPMCYEPSIFVIDRETRTRMAWLIWKNTMLRVIRLSNIHVNTIYYYKPKEQLYLKRLSVFHCICNDSCPVSNKQHSHSLTFVAPKLLGSLINTLNHVWWFIHCTALSFNNVYASTQTVKGFR